MAKFACAVIMLLGCCSGLVQRGRAAVAVANPSTASALIGTTSLLNNAAAMTVRNMALEGQNGPEHDAGDVALALGRTYEFLVTTGITSVTSWCRMSNATGNYEQKVLTWSTDPSRVQAVPCGTTCSWSADGNGFWVTNPSNQQQVFVVGWNVV